MKNKLFLLLLCMVSVLLNHRAYSQSFVKGMILEDKNRQPLKDVLIENQSTKSTAISNDKGKFEIRAKIGDRLVFKNGFLDTDTLYLTSLNDVTVLLTLKNSVLPEIIVRNSDAKINNVVHHSKGLFNSRTILYQTDAGGNPIGGLKFMIHDSHAGERNKRKIISISKDQEDQVAIAALFSPESLKNYLPIKGQELTNFIKMSAPDLNTYRSPGFNLTIYLSTCYKKFLLVPKEVRASATFLALDTLGKK